jgi:hypothetical protein
MKRYMDFVKKDKMTRHGTFVILYTIIQFLISMGVI